MKLRERDSTSRKKAKEEEEKRKREAAKVGEGKRVSLWLINVKWEEYFLMSITGQGANSGVNECEYKDCVPCLAFLPWLFGGNGLSTCPCMLFIRLSHQKGKAFI